jgi:hypothetical protein
MTRKTVALLATLSLVPAIAFAQRGRGGGVSGAPASRQPTASRLRLPSRGDIEDLSPSAFLRDKRKKLQLADADVNALKAAETAAKDRNKVVLTAYDSVRKEMQALSDAPEIGSNADAAVLRRMAFSNLMEQIHNQRTADRAEALAAIPADKKEQAEALLKEQDEEFDRTVGSAGRGRRGGGE